VGCMASEVNYADLQAEQIDWKRLIELTVKRLKDEMSTEEIDALFVSTYDNWRYLTGLPVHFSSGMFFTNLSILTVDIDFPTLLPLGDLATFLDTVAPWFKDIRPLPFEGTREARQPLGAGLWMDIIANTLKDLGVDGGRIAFDPGAWRLFKRARPKRR